MRELWSRWRAWATGRRGIAEDLVEEMRSHVEMDAAEHGEGMTEEEALAAARRRFGNATRIAEASRARWGFPALESVLQDARYGVRALRRAPVFTLVAMLTFGLGVGVNTAVFGVVRSVLLKPWPYPEAERLVRFGESAGKAEGISVSWGNYRQWRANQHSFDEMAAFQFTEQTLTGRGEALVTRGMTVTAPYFGLLGMQPLYGRFFTEAEDRAGGPPVVVLNHGFWQGALGGDPNVVGTALVLNGTAYEVIGVAAPFRDWARCEYYLPLSPVAGDAGNRARHGSIRMLARLKAGVSVAGARAGLDAVMRHLAEADPGPENDHRSYGRSFAETTTEGMRETLWMLMAAAGLILLIACANATSLLLARNTARASELALRRAVGAGRFRVARQLLTETVVLAGAGGAAGVALAYGSLRVLAAAAPAGMARVADAGIDAGVLWFAAAISMGAGVLAGLAPVMAAGEADLTAVLKEGARTAGTGRRRQGMRQALVVGEVALTFVLAFGSALLLRSLAAAQRTDPGFDTRNAFAFGLQLPEKGYAGEAAAQFYGRLLAELRAVPGAAGVTMVHCPPGAGDCGDWFYSIPGRALPPDGDVPVALFNTVEAGYFRTMGIAMREGREFTETDRKGGLPVAVVNETLARRWWPEGRAVGHQIKIGGPYREGGLLEVVGVARDVRQFGLDAEAEPEIYQPFAQEPGRGMVVAMRGAGETAGLMAAARQRVAALDRNLPVREMATFEQSLGAGLGRRRFTAVLLALFAGLAMTLAAAGIYGMLSYWVGSREREIAVRMALGAAPGAVVGWTSLQALRLAGLGMALGAAGAWAAGRGMEKLLYGVEAQNPAALAGAAGVVAALAVVAAAGPAWRAARLDVVRGLHEG